MSKVTFNVAGEEDEKTIFSWLTEPHMVEFWDNSQEHKDDISNFIHGRKQLYFTGTTKYFIGRIDNVPFAFILGDIIDADKIYLHYKRRLYLNLAIQYLLILALAIKII